MTAHHNTALTQPRQNLPEGREGQLFWRQVDEHMRHMMDREQLRYEIVAVVVEVVGEPFEAIREVV
jgi:hypothetical protein